MIFKSINLDFFATVALFGALTWVGGVEWDDRRARPAVTIIVCLKIDHQRWEAMAADEMYENFDSIFCALSTSCCLMSADLYAKQSDLMDYNDVDDLNSQQVICGKI